MMSNRRPKHGADNGRNPADGASDAGEDESRRDLDLRFTNILAEYHYHTPCPSCHALPLPDLNTRVPAWEEEDKEDGEAKVFSPPVVVLDSMRRTAPNQRSVRDFWMGRRSPSSISTPRFLLGRSRTRRMGRTRWSPRSRACPSGARLHAPDLIVPEPELLGGGVPAILLHGRVTFDMSATSSPPPSPRTWGPAQPSPPDSAWPHSEPFAYITEPEGEACYL
ncbi:hypothetical protein ZWY2020_043265 [Hordeum vulgare]|nr:hypothetical protein ZWY2020_043265 [Hordeum vulgare]